MEIINAQIKSFTYRNSTEVSVKNIDLSIKEGEIVIFTGLSGSGKTTLTRILNGLAPGQYEGELEGSVKILGKEVKDYQKGELCNTILLINQDGESRKDILDEEELKNLKEYFSLRKEI